MNGRLSRLLKGLLKHTQHHRGSSLSASSAALQTQTGAVLSPSLQSSEPEPAQPLLQWDLSSSYQEVFLPASQVNTAKSTFYGLFVVFFGLFVFSPSYKLLKKKKLMFICLPEAGPAKGVSGKEISHSTPVMCKHPTVKPQRAHPEPRTPTPHFHSGEMLWQ